MSSPSYVSVSHPPIYSGDIRACWLERGGIYALQVGRHVNAYLTESDARQLFSQLSAAMAERGDIVDWEAIAKRTVAELESLATDLDRGYEDDSYGRIRATLERLGCLGKQDAIAVDDKMRADAAEAEERQWATIVGVRDEPSVDGIEDHATDRSRDERMGAS